MKTIRCSFYVFFVCTMLLCSSCGYFNNQRYICQVDMVESVQIVRLDEYIESEYRYEYSVLSEITDCSKFVERLNNLKYSVNMGEPSQLDTKYVVIKVEYSNGDYDLLYSNAQWFNRSGVNQYGYFFFDNEQFNELVTDYLITQGTVSVKTDR